MAVKPGENTHEAGHEEFTHKLYFLGKQSRKLTLCLTYGDVKQTC